MPPSIWSFTFAALAGVFAVLLAVATVSLNGLSRGTVRKLEERHRQLAERLDALLRQRDSRIMAFRLLLLADMLVLLAFLADILAATRGGSGSARPALLICVALGLFAYFLLSELVGRHLSGPGAARYLVGFSTVVRILSIPLQPILWPVRLLHTRIDAWQGERQQQDERATAEDEIMSLVESSDEEADTPNELEDDERRMIRGVFDLDERLVREIMTPRVDLKTLPDTATTDEARALIVETGHSRIPVYHDSVDRIVGVVYGKDLLDEARVASAKDLSGLFHTPLLIPETKNVGDLLADFQQSQIHFAVVLDEYGGTAGIVSIEDVLEEIVGEIRDEYDIHEKELELVLEDDGSVTADARVPLDQVLEILDIPPPEKSDCETLGGYITSSVGRIPEAGETVENTLFQFEILEADMRRVLRTRVRPCQTEEDPADHE